MALRQNWSRHPSSDSRATNAFTLIELLVVLAIIGLILALSIPNFRGMGEGTAMNGAVRQLMNDLAFARQQAIATRSTVAVVFLTSEVKDITPGMIPSAMPEQVQSLQGGGLTTFALYSFRRVGDQPGRAQRGYLTEWRSLPEKTFISETMFLDPPPVGLPRMKLPYPAEAIGFSLELPYIAFNPQGQCVAWDEASSKWVEARDVNLMLARGSILYSRDPLTGNLLSFDVQEVPPGNSITSSNVIHIDWLTGRAEHLRADVPLQ